MSGGGSREYVYQCQNCGSLHKVKMQFNADDELFIMIKCPQCKKDTKHLWVGDRPESVYWYGNANLDPRFYKY